MAFRSSSVIWPILNQGMGGRMARPAPRCLPVRMALIKAASVQEPVPVALSGVRFMAKLTPQGPYQAVKCWLVTATHLAGSAPMISLGSGGSLSAAGCPDSNLDESGIGPIAVMALGEWQSLQPPNVTRYSPRLTMEVSVLP